VVPVLWNRTESTTPPRVAFQNENLDLRAVSLPGSSEGVRAACLELQADRHGLGALRALVRSLSWDGPHTDEMLALGFPRDGETLARSFSRTVSGLLGPLGLVLLEPDWLPVRLARSLAAVVGEDPGPALVAEAERLAELGYAPAEDPRESPLVSRLDGPGATPLRLGGDGFRYEGEVGSRTPAELAAEIVQAPAEWAAGPLLLPLVQAAALPVAVHVGGRDELARHAQTAGLRAERGVADAPFAPRLAATLLEPECERALARLELRVRDVLSGALAETPPETEVHVPAADRLRGVAERTVRELGEARDDLARVDRGLAGQLRRTAAEVRDRIEGLARRAERVERNRLGKGDRHARRLRNALLPDGRPQEQVLSALTLVARHGREVLDRLADEIEPLPTEHCVVRLDT
jgi:uncharacterized protein YllA (UPF0747 family)